MNYLAIWRSTTRIIRRWRLRSVSILAFCVRICANERHFLNEDLSSKVAFFSYIFSVWLIFSAKSLTKSWMLLRYENNVGILSTFCNFNFSVPAYFSVIPVCSNFLKARGNLHQFIELMMNVIFVRVFLLSNYNLENYAKNYALKKNGCPRIEANTFAFGDPSNFLKKKT